MKTIARAMYEGLKAEAEKFGGVGSHMLMDLEGDPVCLWGLAIHARLTDMCPYSLPYEGRPDDDWRSYASRVAPKDKQPLPSWLTVDSAVDRVRKRLGMRTFLDVGVIAKRVPLDELLAELGITVEPTPTIDDELGYPGVESLGIPGDTNG